MDEEDLRAERDTLLRKFKEVAAELAVYQSTPDAKSAREKIAKLEREIEHQKRQVAGAEQAAKVLRAENRRVVAALVRTTADVLGVLGNDD